MTQMQNCGRLPQFNDIFLLQRYISENFMKIRLVAANRQTDRQTGRQTDEYRQTNAE